MPCVSRKSQGQRYARINEGLRLALQMQTLEWSTSDASQPFVALQLLGGR